MASWGVHRMDNDVSAYPPYLTDLGMRCPLLYDLSKRWRPREKMWTPYRLLGTAVAAGLEAFYKGEGDPYEVAQEVVRAGYEEGSDYTVGGLIKHARAGVLAGSQTDLGCTPFAVEQEYARIRPDVVGHKPNGRLRIVDHKVKLTLDSKYLGSELKRWEASNQMYHYAWGVSQHYGELVEDVCVHVIILGPKPRTILHPALRDLTQARLDWWYAGAEAAWQEMDAIDTGEQGPVPRLSGCFDKWGTCPMWEGCHLLYGDEAVFGGVYDRVTRRGE